MAHVSTPEWLLWSLCEGISVFWPAIESKTPRKNMESMCASELLRTTSRNPAVSSHYTHLLPIYPQNSHEDLVF